MNVVKVPLAHGGKRLRQGAPRVTKQGEVVVSEIGREKNLRVVPQAVAGQQVRDPNMVAGEAGQNLLLRVEKLEPGTIVGQAETDETVMDEARKVRLESSEELFLGQIGRIVNGRQRLFLAFQRRRVFIKFQDQKSFCRQAGSEGAKNCGDLFRAGQGGEAKGVGSILEGGEAIPLTDRLAAMAQFTWPKADAQGVIGYF